MAKQDCAPEDPRFSVLWVGHCMTTMIWFRTGKTWVTK